MISLVRNLKCISQQNIHHYLNRRYKFYITSLKAVIASKSLISVALDIDRILHFVSHNKILQIYRQHWIRKFYRHILSKYRQISKKWGGCYTPTHDARHAHDYKLCRNFTIMWKYKCYCEYWSCKEKRFKLTFIHVTGLQSLIIVEKLKVIPK